MNNAALVQAESLSQAVIEAVASREDVEPMALETPLYEAVDPDALDALVETTASQHDRASLEIEFTYHGYHVRVSADGVVHLSRAA